MNKTAAQAIFPASRSMFGAALWPGVGAVPVVQRAAVFARADREAVIPAAARRRMGPRALRLLRADD